jgi:hypothetical protein
MSFSDNGHHKELQKSIEYAQRKIDFSKGAECGLKLQYIRHFECKLGISKGNQVKIAFEDGDETVIYMGAHSTGFYVWVNFQTYTKAGKVRKNLSREDYDIMQFIKVE